MLKIKNILKRIYVILVFTIVLMSCSTNKVTKINSETIFFPPPPDTAKVQFLTVLNSSTDIAEETSSFTKFLRGRDNTTEIKKPFGICAIKNKIFVVDSKAGGIDIIDLQKKSIDFINPPGLGNLKFPVNCVADTSGNLFVADQVRKEIVVYDYDLNYKTAFGLKIFEKPTDVCLYKDKIYVSDMKNHKIYIFSIGDYKLITSFPDVSDKDTSYLHQPIHMAVNNDMIYVTDFGEFHIKKFDIKGNFIGTVGFYGQSPGQFSRPKGIALDRNELLYAIDAGFSNVQIFNKFGQLMLFFGGEKVGRGFLASPIKVSIDYDNLDFFKEYVDSKYRLMYLIYVTNQFGGDKVTVYGFVELK